VQAPPVHRCGQCCAQRARSTPRVRLAPRAGARSRRSEATTAPAPPARLTRRSKAPAPAANPPRHRRSICGAQSGRPLPQQGPRAPRLPRRLSDCPPSPLAAGWGRTYLRPRDQAGCLPTPAPCRHSARFGGRHHNGRRPRQQRKGPRPPPRPRATACMRPCLTQPHPPPPRPAPAAAPPPPPAPRPQSPSQTYLDVPAPPSRREPLWCEQERAVGVDLARQIFCNRSLNMKQVTAIGWDMDYTVSSGGGGHRGEGLGAWLAAADGAGAGRGPMDGAGRGPGFPRQGGARGKAAAAPSRMGPSHPTPLAEPSGGERPVAAVRPSPQPGPGSRPPLAPPPPAARPRSPSTSPRRLRSSHTARQWTSWSRPLATPPHCTTLRLTTTS
jgi:hypothetical protein